MGTIVDVHSDDNRRDDHCGGEPTVFLVLLRLLVTPMLGIHPHECRPICRKLRLNSRGPREFVGTTEGIKRCAIILRRVPRIDRYIPEEPRDPIGDEILHWAGRR